MNSTELNNICLIDDEEHFVLLQKSLLEKDGANVKTFSRVNEFLLFLEQNPASINNFDLIIIDRFFPLENYDSLEDKLAYQLKSSNICHGNYTYTGSVCLWSSSEICFENARKNGFDLSLPKEIFSKKELEDLLMLASSK